MGLEGVENLTGDEDREPRVAPPRPTDQELEDQRQAELQKERDLHNEKTGGGAHPTSDQK